MSPSCRDPNPRILNAKPPALSGHRPGTKHRAGIRPESGRRLSIEGPAKRESFEGLRIRGRSERSVGTQACGVEGSQIADRTHQQFANYRSERLRV